MNTHKLQDIILNSSNIVAFTGAGISAESGIPTYRGADGLWNKYNPNKYANIRYFYRNPAYYWNFFKDVRYQMLKTAVPNLAHKILAKLEMEGQLQAVITQNIDGLHQKAGSRNVLELHGNTRSFSCQECSQNYDFEQAYSLLQNKLPPLCSSCQGLLKPDVVMFGEALPVKILHKARELASQCDLFLAIGSSLLVQPAASLPVIAIKAGAKLVIINKDKTRLDSRANLVISDAASKVLKESTAKHFPKN